ncbi:anti-anti-sigma factor [Fischerella thermalis CCMEE 5273]|uniref:Anti-sigma factor antagonist n=4 Tax=Hapalosiphonaceae TaxID=1892263 RepID=A0A1U7GW52_9CYAN|nr:anti-anti-sigma factor [Fischerella major NIES-592]PLZ07949.1 anti-anti-sigma factor [Fischerella thermalis WC114]PLZ08605.1 anti-anti-sigma factor [Fischerella thermalis WC119]PLZ14984.1 anti-anti-sigma factor [Fischerella thermalis WC1110]PLZ22463.1 anti-anti-sigma factor [Fischerella thermalis WC341]PLZ23497.1 anti-anti-sigma factor [Fischerella thermalis WC157]PLZ30733.1 anti-anti-sigma factor [Fischerella thermalis WC559]PLZ32841.1 anti-anti-sigma factor [Fischerella thermalis WC558]
MISQPQEVDFPVMFLHDTAIVQVSERLSVLEAVAFKQTCQNITQANPIPQKIIIDFQQTTFMDSSGLGALVSNFKIAQDRGIEFILRNVTPQVMAVLNLTGLEKVFFIESSDLLPVPSKNQLEEQLPTTHPSVRSWMKRLIDIVGALVGLVIVAILFIPIAVAIAIDDPGPIFFSQVRCGWMGKRFRIWKFRSMYVDAEARKAELAKHNQVQGAFFKIDNDPRITKIGRFLRRTSLDELPQFWNVLKGEMSLVGTRPPTPDEVERYEVPEWQRLDVKPGMTGEWQVNGRSTVRKFEDVIRLDLQYQKNWSLLYDLKLILKTVAILFHKNSGAV